MKDNITRAWASCYNCDVPLVFKRPSALQQYLIKKGRILNQPNHIFKDIFNSLVKIITEEEMLDPTCKGMIVLNHELSNALNANGMHAMQIPARIYVQALYSEEIGKLVDTCNNILLEKEHQNKRHKEDLKHQWFVPKGNRHIYRCLRLPPQQELISGGEIAARINYFIESENIFDIHNKEICILRGNCSTTATNLKIALNVNSFHKASLWDLVLLQFEKLNQHSASSKISNRRGSTFFASSSSPTSKSNKQTHNKAPNRQINARRIMTEFFRVLVLFVLAITKNPLHTAKSSQPAIERE